MVDSNARKFAVFKMRMAQKQSYINFKPPNRNYFSTSFIPSTTKLFGCDCGRWILVAAQYLYPTLKVILYGRMTGNLELTLMPKLVDSNSTLRADQFSFRPQKLHLAYQPLTSPRTGLGFIIILVSTSSWLVLWSITFCRFSCLYS